MALKYMVKVGKLKKGRYEYLTNFYTTRISATSTAPAEVSNASDADRLSHEIDAHGSVYTVVPDDEPNALHVINRLLSVMTKEPVLGLNIYLEEFGDDGIASKDKRSLFLHDVKLVQIVATNAAGYSPEPGGGYRDDSSMTAWFQGVVGPIQEIA